MNHSSLLDNSSNARFQARQLSYCRQSRLSDGEVASGWDIENEFDPEGSGWAERVRLTSPHIEEDEMFLLHRIEWAIRGLVEKVGATKTWDRQG